jgi:hypothetical protein
MICRRQKDTSFLTPFTFNISINITCSIKHSSWSINLYDMLLNFRLRIENLVVHARSQLCYDMEIKEVILRNLKNLNSEAGFIFNFLFFLCWFFFSNTSSVSFTIFRWLLSRCKYRLCKGKSNVFNYKFWLGKK